MRVYLAGYQGSTEERESRLITSGASKNRCFSFANLEPIEGLPFMVKGIQAGYKTCVESGKIGIMMDSGVFSYRTHKARLIKNGKSIKDLPTADEYIRQYVKYCKKYSHLWSFYVTVDLRPVAAENLILHGKLEKMGVRPVPVFHGDDSIDYLKRYVDKGYDFICLGSTNSVRTGKSQFKKYYDSVFNFGAKHKVEFHGLAQTKPWAMLDYPWRSVDSLDGKTSFVIVRQAGRVRVANIKELFWSVPGPVLLESNGRASKEAFDLEVLSLDRYGNSVWKKLTTVIRRKTVKRITRVQALRGATVDVTSDHSLMSSSAVAFDPYPVTSKQLEKGDKLVTSWQLPSNGALSELIVDIPHSFWCSKTFGGSSSSKVQLPVRVALDKEFLEFIGLWLADGSYDGTCVQISCGNDRECLAVLEAVGRRFCPHGIVRLERNGVDVRISCARLYNVMCALGLKGTSRTKELPWWVFDLPPMLRCSLLRGYFSGDGSSHGMPSVSTASDKLFYGVLLLLQSEVGDTLSVPRFRTKGSLGGFSYSNPDLPRTGGTIGVSGVEAIRVFVDKIGFLQKRHNDRVLRSRGLNPKTKMRTPKTVRFEAAVVTPLYKKKNVGFFNRHVYDLSVDYDDDFQAFLANAVFVHNSSSWSRAAGYGCLLKFNPETCRLATLHVSDRVSGAAKLHINSRLLSRIKKDVEDDGYDFEELRVDHTARHVYNAFTMQKMADFAASRQKLGSWRVLF